MNRIRQYVEGLRPIDFCFLGGYALYLAFGYMAFESSTVLSSGGDLGAQAISLFIIVTLAGRLAAFVGAALVSVRHPGLGPVGFIAVASVLGLAGFLVMGMLLQFVLDVPAVTTLPWLGLSGALLGAAAAVGGLVWARFVSMLGIRAAYLYVVFSNLTSLPVYFIITLLPSATYVPLCCVVFFTSMALAKPCIDMRPATTECITRDAVREASARLWRPVLGTCVLAFMSGFMLQVALWHPIPLDVFQGTSLITQFVVMAALLVPALVVKRPIALASVYKVALPLSAMGFLLLPVIWTNGGGLANACAQLGYLVAGIILWCMLADNARELRLPSALLFSLGSGCIVIAQMVGAIVGFVGRKTLAPGDVTVTAVALVSIYAVAMVSMFLFKDRSFKGKSAEHAGDAANRSDTRGAMAVAARENEASGVEVAETEENGRSALDVMRECCDAIGERAHLTPREREIFLYLGRGHTVSAIAKELVVSENTVKFHVKGIYQKLDVHSRADVMALIDKERVH